MNGDGLISFNSTAGLPSLSCLNFHNRLILW